MKLENEEKEWRKSPIRLPPEELIIVFPEAKPIILTKLKEYQKEKEYLEKCIRNKLEKIASAECDQFSKWFYREWIKVNEVCKLLEIERNIARLKYIAYPLKHRKSNSRIDKRQIQEALAVPIEKLIDIPLRKSGKKLTGLCPFHSEKRTSFFIYPETNSFYCFGCNQGGNSIHFVRLLYNSSFPEAVRFINK